MKEKRKPQLKSKRRRQPWPLTLPRTILLCGAAGFLVLSVIVGSNAMRKEGHGRVYASEDGDNLEVNTADSARQLPSGLAGVISSVNEVPVPGSKVKRIGTSCEDMLVGQRVTTVENPPVNLNVSSSMENTVNSLDLQSQSMASSPKMMSDEDYKWLLRIVEAEAGEGDVKSRVLVANVIMNRVRREDFPNTITDVVFQNVNGVPQFSPTYDGSIYSVTVTEDTKEAVKEALNGKDYSEGALFFIQKDAAEDHNVTWFERDLKRLFKYGVHEYYTYPETVDMKASEPSKSKKAA